MLPFATIAAASIRLAFWSNISSIKIYVTKANSLPTDRSVEADALVGGLEVPSESVSPVNSPIIRVFQAVVNEHNMEPSLDHFKEGVGVFLHPTWVSRTAFVTEVYLG